MSVTITLADPLADRLQAGRRHATFPCSSGLWPFLHTPPNIRTTPPGGRS